MEMNLSEKPSLARVKRVNVLKNSDIDVPDAFDRSRNASNAKLLTGKKTLDIEDKMEIRSISDEEEINIYGS